MTSKALLILPVLLLGVLPTHAQEADDGPTEVQVAFDSLRVRLVDGRTVAEWLRPVLQQEDFRLRANNGYDEGNGFIQFWGDVVITEAGDTIRAERVRYQRKERIGDAQGKVRMTDGEVTLVAPFARYFSREERTVFDQGVTYRDSSSVLTAAWAQYLSEDNRASFSRHVVLTQEDLTLFADSVLHLRESEVSQAWGRIAVERISASDSIRTLIIADSLYRNAAVDSIRVTGRARLLRIDPAGPDTLLLQASLIKVPGPGRLEARDSVAVAAAGYAFRADSLTSAENDDGGTQTRLSGNPSAWVEETQVVAQRMTMTDNASQDTLRAAGNVFVATPDSLSGRLNQLSGQSLAAIMSSDSLRVLDIREQARAVLFMESENEGDTVGFSGSGDGLRFHFKDGQLDRVAFYAGVEGTYFAEDMLDQLSNLRGFIFSPESRPSRQELMATFWMVWSERVHRTSSTAEQMPCRGGC